MKSGASTKPGAPEKYVLFDLLSALIDSWSLWDDIAGGQGPGRAWRMEYLRRTYDAGAYVPYLDLVSDAAGAVGLPCGCAAKLDARWDELRPWPEAERVLRELARGAVLGVATNCSDALGRRAAARIGFPFAAVVTAESAGCYKPCRRIYAMGAEALGARPEDVLFVAGSPFDVAGAADAKMRVIWHNRAGLDAGGAACRATFVVPELTALPGLAALSGAEGR